MTDKERIEEIAKAREHFNHGISHDIFKEPVTSYAKAAVEGLDLMENIISKDLVVLSEKEKTDLYVEAWNKGFAHGRKETARDILNAMLDIKPDFSLLDGCTPSEFMRSVDLATNIIFQAVKEQAKRYGVEVEE